MSRAPLWLFVERCAWIVAVACLGSWGFFLLAGAAGARHELERFQAARDRAELASTNPDLSLWSPQRILAWRESLIKPSPPPLAVLRIGRIRLEVPVLAGTDDWTLNRAVGHIEDTAEPGGDGNSGIAGHRDGFFRGLKDVEPGDALELDTLRATHRYRIERIWIVEPEDVSVLDSTPSPAVTLVTCYPFYFVGSAPQRYIVRAQRIASTPKNGAN